MMRTIVILLLIMTALQTGFSQSLKTKNVVIVTMDGFRWRELFCGADENLLDKSKYDNDVFEQFGGESPDERRRKLMPFFWDVIAAQGQLYGNRKAGNKVNITNSNFYSYSGYSEMFVGFVDPKIKNNTPQQNPNYNVLSRINDDPAFAGRVAVFSTWDVMSQILREQVSGIYMNTGSEKATGGALTAHEHILNFLADSISNPLGARFDQFTFQYAVEYMKRERPRVVFISLDETDERAHAGQYLPYLNSAQRVDRMIGELWSWLQSQPDYKDQTTLIIGTDHGRGRSARGWKHHRILFRGSSQVWLAILGPDTPAGGEMKQRMKLKQTQVAKTIAAFLSVPYSNVKPVGDVITSAFNDDVLMSADYGITGAGN
jgi:hypothetical protein